MSMLVKIRGKIYFLILQFLLQSIKFLRSNRSNSEMIEKLDKLDKPQRDFDAPEYDFSIIIVTFESRFFEYALPLVKNLRTDVDTPIFILINGNYAKANRNSKLQIFLKELSNFDNIYPIAFASFRGCAELWNTGIVNSDSEYYLILNDDVTVYPNSIIIRLNMLGDLLMKHGLVTINHSFSYFGISRKCIDEVGFFDEHFIGMGEEDRDYAYRFESLYSRKHGNLSTSSFVHFGDESADQSIKKIPKNKRSLFNLEHYEKIYTSDLSGKIQGVYEKPMRRTQDFRNPRPIWKFRISNYKNLSE
ncbi:MAG: hypothetical protein O2823_02950 [Actinomycetota bacterium]|nr:hypothetical protein [Actinomycetota bacterium]